MIQFQDIDLKTFLNDYWQQKPILLKNALPAFEAPITPEEMAGLSLEPEVESRLVLQHGETDYELRQGPFEETTYETLPEQNWTLLVQGMDRLLPEMHDLLAHFDFLPRWRIDDIMASYATTGGNVGPHFDHYDVFLLQAAGQRRWQLTAQDCFEDNYLPGVDLRLMQRFEVEDDYVLNPGDVLYVPPKWGHHGIAMDDECMTFSIGYRTYRGQEMWDSLGDHLAETQTFQDLYRDPKWSSNLQPGKVPPEAAQQAKELMQTMLEDEALLHTWMGRFATQLDQSGAQQLPEPLDETEKADLKTFVDALQQSPGLVKDPVCRFAFVQGTPVKLFINGTQWDTQGASNDLIRTLANQDQLTTEDCAEESGHKLLHDLWQLQYLMLSE
jgi:50S ribosomal protein L16 3-hydroxylase